MEISSASTLRGFAVIRREGVNLQPAGAEGVDGNESGVSNAIADVIDISTEGRSFANQEENNGQSASQGRSPLFGENTKKSNRPTLIGQQPEKSSEATITAAVLSGAPDDAIPEQGDEPEEGSQLAPAEQQPVHASRAPSAQQELTNEEKQTVNELKQRDAEVRAHEQAHLAAAGQYASGGIQYNYQKGPDGRQYAVGGEVSISMPSGNTPEESLQIARQVERAANAPSSPSSADRAIAAAARAKAAAAMREMSKESLEETKDNREAVNSSSGGVAPTENRPEGQEIPISGTGQPENEPVTISGRTSNAEGSQVGRSTGSEVPLFGVVSDPDIPPIGEAPQNDEIGIQANRTVANGIQGSDLDNESTGQSSQNGLPELIDLINGLDQSSTTEEDNQFGEISEPESAGSRGSLQSLLRLVDSL